MGTAIQMVLDCQALPRERVIVDQSKVKVGEVAVAVPVLVAAVARSEIAPGEKWLHLNCRGLTRD